MKMNKEIDYKEFETKLLNMYPTLSKKETHAIIKQLFNFWWNMIEDLDKYIK